MLIINFLPVIAAPKASLSQPFLKMVYSTTAISITIIKGRKKAEGICWTVYTPIAEPITDRGNSFFTSWISILPDFTKVTKLAKAPITADILLVPSTCRGDMPVIISAGSEIMPPPPTAASTKDARKPAAHTNIYISMSKKPPHVISIHNYSII